MSFRSQRAADSASAAAGEPANGLVRAGRKRPRPKVVPDGARTRYPGGAHSCARNERAFYTSTWVVPQDGSLVPNVGDEAFLFFKPYIPGGKRYETLHQTMATLNFTNASQSLRPQTQIE